MPARADFDVVRDLRPYLGHLELVEVLDHEHDFRYRVYGCALTALTGDERQGKRLSEIDSMSGGQMRAMFEQVVRTREPAEFRYEGLRGRRPTVYDALMLPLSSNGEDVQMILAYVAATERAAT